MYGDDAARMDLVRGRRARARPRPRARARAERADGLDARSEPRTAAGRLGAHHRRRGRLGRLRRRPPHLRAGQPPERRPCAVTPSQTTAVAGLDAQLRRVRPLRLGRGHRRGDRDLPRSRPSWRSPARPASAIYYLPPDGGAPQRLQSSFDASNATATAGLPHFSTFAAGAATWTVTLDRRRRPQRPRRHVRQRPAGHDRRRDAGPRSDRTSASCGSSAATAPTASSSPTPAGSSPARSSSRATTATTPSPLRTSTTSGASMV